jgi:hypothetical protein
MSPLTENWEVKTNEHSFHAGIKENITTRNKKLKIAQNGCHHDTQTNTNTIRHNTVKTNRTSFLCGNSNGPGTSQHVT